MPPQPGPTFAVEEDFTLFCNFLQFFAIFLDFLVFWKFRYEVSAAGVSKTSFYLY